jgi:radical SAM superfamily enzyme YgiQ (UPF0313 family)
MKILLIRPDISNISSGYKLNDGRMEPLPLGILAGLTPEDVEVVLRDERVEELSFDEPADLVAISVDTFVARRAYAIADEFRRRGVRVVLGGIHVTLAPEEAARHADAVVVGDAEPVWSQVLSDAAAGGLRARYREEFDVPQKEVLPRREIFKGKGYLPVSLVQFTRGCPFRCSFCAIAQFFGSTHRCRPVEAVIREIQENDLRIILFTDDNLTANRERAKELFRAIKPLKVRWASQVSVDVVADPEMMELMAESGCMGQLIGFDSISLPSLLWMNKGANLRQFDHYARAIEQLRAFGFQTWASFMFGNDFDTPETIQATVRFAIDHKFSLAFFHLLMPYPGTALYAELQQQGRLLYNGRWWDHPRWRYGDTTFRPRFMAPQELSEWTAWANREFYSVSSIATRAFDLKTNMRSLIKLLLYARFNTLVRRTST